VNLSPTESRALSSGGSPRGSGHHPQRSEDHLRLLPARLIEPSIIALVAIGLCAPDTVLAQRTRADSIARSDSIARADSILLQGELARIRGERRRVDPTPGRAGDSSGRSGEVHSPRLHIGANVGTGSPWVEDDAGVVVKSPIVGGLGIGALWSLGGGYGMGADVRVTTGRVTIDEGGDSRSAGSATQLDLIGTIERRIGDRFGARVGGGAAWVFGPDEVVPFRYGNSARLQPTAEFGLLARLTTSRPLFATFTAQTTRFGNATLEDPVTEPGWVNRILVGIRYDR
jgi:hypothetical protein